jgi:hypothetical protein
MSDKIIDHTTIPATSFSDEFVCAFCKEKSDPSEFSDELCDSCSDFVEDKCAHCNQWVAMDARMACDKCFDYFCESCLKYICQTAPYPHDINTSCLEKARGKVLCPKCINNAKLHKKKTHRPLHYK